MKSSRLIWRKTYKIANVGRFAFAVLVFKKETERNEDNRQKRLLTFCRFSYSWRQQILFKVFLFKVFCSEFWIERLQTQKKKFQLLDCQKFDSKKDFRACQFHSECVTFTFQNIPLERCQQKSLKMSKS